MMCNILAVMYFKTGGGPPWPLEDDSLQFEIDGGGYVSINQSVHFRVINVPDAPTLNINASNAEDISANILVHTSLGSILTVNSADYGTYALQLTILSTVRNALSSPLQMGGICQGRNSSSILVCMVRINLTLFTPRVYEFLNRYFTCHPQ